MAVKVETYAGTEIRKASQPRAGFRAKLHRRVWKVYIRRMNRLNRKVAKINRTRDGLVKSAVAHRQAGWERVM